MAFARRCTLVVALSLVVACSSSKGDDPAPQPTGHALVAFDLAADFTSDKAFFDFPYPSDLRLSPQGSPYGSSFPNPLDKPVIVGMRANVDDRKGFPVVPTAYFRFDQPLAARALETVIPGDAKQTVLLLDVDDASPERGKLFPTVATVLPTDDYVPANLLGVAARPGILLHEKRKYAFVVLRAFGDAKGAPLDVPPALSTLASGGAPATSNGAAAQALYAPLWKTLQNAGIAANDVAAATVFTTGDASGDFAALSTKVVEKYDAPITDLKVDPDDGAAHDRYCELVGKISYPQFQKGVAPFNTEGRFEIDTDGLPKKQRDETVPITITLPKQAMPAGGYPLDVYFHGSGGLSTAVVDRGRWHPESDPTRCPEGTTDTWLGTKGCNTKGEGPAFVLAPHGIAAAGSALPVNPERVKGASSIEYLNFGNLAAMRDTFRQGAIEQRLFIEALRSLKITPETVSTCTGLSLPPGETAYRFRDDFVTAQGQSMGGMYTNIIGAIEPRIHAVVPTGAGGYWGYFITLPDVLGYPHVGGFVAAFAGTADDLVFMHPVLQLFETGAEVSDPMVYMPHLARRPFSGHPVRPIYEPVGKGDSYFPTVLYDAVALAYGHKEAGDVIWPSMQDTLKLESLEGVLAYPLSQDLTSEDGTKYTAAVLQYAGDGIYDPHALYTQLDSVQYQYGCFLETFFAKGLATIPAPAPLGTPCPGK
jgi:hypothetical protein